MNEETKRAYLFIKTEDSQSVEVVATRYRDADRNITKMIGWGELSRGEWRYDSNRLIKNNKQR